MTDRRSFDDDALAPLRAELQRRADALAAAAAGGAAALAGPVGRLSAAARALFELEERRLRDAGSPSLTRHAMEHERFLASLAEVVRLAGAGADAELAVLRPATFVGAWLDAHSRTDAELPRG
ncbi:MAG TPA: hypothetical protein VML50_07500 [Anaeromyxobacter sp.]|nr:hypothetical protein [Anaeromyxobacter sp.]